MNAQQSKQAFQIANSNADLTNVDNDILIGYGLPNFQPVSVTLQQVAKEMRWHARQLNGEWDSEALNQVISLGRKRFNILN